MAEYDAKIVQEPQLPLDAQKQIISEMKGATDRDAQAAPEIQRGLQPYLSGQSKTVSQETVDLIRQTQADTTRAINMATGFIGYQLETPAKAIYPLDTPLLNITPRSMSVGIDTEHWKVYTSIFGGNGPMGQTNLGTVDDGSATIDQPVYNVAQVINTYQTIGEYNSVTFQAAWRGRQLEGDLVARRTAETLYALKLQEENWLINVGANLWSPPAAPLLSTAATGGTL